MPPQPTYQEYVSLWHEFAEAARNYIELLKEQERVAGVNIERFRELEALVERARIRWDATRSAIRLHLGE
jgi:hypothetical protein